MTRRMKRRVTRRVGMMAVAASLILGASWAVAVDSGTDVLVPAAGRGAGYEGSTWITDLTVLNLDSQTVAVEIFWLARRQANLDPPSVLFNVAPGAALVLEDVIHETFGIEEGGGAFRVVADGEVVVTSRIYNLQGTVTFGQGFEGVPRLAAVAAGDSTDVVGLRENDSFRTNIVLIETSDRPGGSSVELSLRDESGEELATATYNLRRFEPLLFSATDLGLASFEYATLHAEVTVGSVIVAASMVDNDPATGDPTTLEAWSPGATVDGTYQFALYDSAFFAAGGELVVENGLVTSVTGTYFNWDKTDGLDPVCTMLFAWGGALSPAVPLADFENGVEFETRYPEGAEVTFTLRFEREAGSSITGEVAAVGSSFTGEDAGCNGTFPDLDLRGGKTE